uniref:Groucho/TLE N-terminal Q-rich domain-containing protein n=2 Tax=Poeciliinae TaxID=586240 RepID=A0A3P9P7C4_POERE
MSVCGGEWGLGVGGWGMGVGQQFPETMNPIYSPKTLKFTTSDSCDRIKDEFQFLQAQYHSLKLECDKLASEKSEMQRHYIMYYEMSYGLNIEMHKQV